MVSTRENHKYAESGLPGITLRNLEVRRCPECGERLVVIPGLEGLHRAIAYAVIQKPARLTPAEVRFLRKWLGFSRTDLADHMGVAPETVSRWETGKAAVGGPAERALRLMVAVKSPVGDYTLDRLRVLGAGVAKPLRIGLRASEQGWLAEAS
jgi:putative zinc finger/helix-turn-helix YgiT family protein